MKRVLIVLLLLCTFVSGCGSTRYADTSDGSTVLSDESTGSSDSMGGGNDSAQAMGYPNVDEKISAALEDSDFQTADLETRSAEMLHLLKNMEADGEIQENSIVSTDSMFWYKYPDGTDGGVMIAPFDENCSGTENSGDYTRGEKITFDSPYYPYPEEDVADLDLSALIMYGLNNDDILAEYEKYQNSWNASHLSTTIDNDCTVEDFKTELSAYNLVIIEEHGYFGSENTPMICTAEEASDSKDEQYANDLLSNRIARVITLKTGNPYYWINPSFFTYYYGSGALSNTIVWIGSCNGYHNDRLVSAFADCGAKGVLGWTETVYTSYDCYMLDAAVCGLMCGDTLGGSLEFAQWVWGSSDNDFMSAHSSVIISDEKAAAQGKIYGDGADAQLVDITDTPGSGSAEEDSSEESSQNSEQNDFSGRTAASDGVYSTTCAREDSQSDNYISQISFEGNQIIVSGSFTFSKRVDGVLDNNSTATVRGEIAFPVNEDTMYGYPLGDGFYPCTMDEFISILQGYNGEKIDFVVVDGVVTDAQAVSEDYESEEYDSEEYYDDYQDY